MSTRPKPQCNPRPHLHSPPYPAPSPFVLPPGRLWSSQSRVPSSIASLAALPLEFVPLLSRPAASRSFSTGQGPRDAQGGEKAESSGRDDVPPGGEGRQAGGSSFGLLAGLGLGFASAGAYFYYYYNMAAQEPVEPPPIPLPPMPEAYVHPYNHWKWYHRYLFIIQRTVKLLYLWTPCVLILFYMLLRGKSTDKEWVDWILDHAVRTLEKSGAGFQKFGQWVAMRPDLFPQSLCKAMAKLQDDAPSHDFEQTRQTIKDSLGYDLEQLFVEFDQKPIASGSVGQVHRAKLRPEYALPTGETEVAVKVRHPKVLDSSFIDIWLIFWVMRASPSLGLSICLPFKEGEFHNNIQKQVDFTWEAYNLLKFNANFRGEVAQEGQLKVRFPTVHTELLSESILIESWAPGENLSSMLARKSSRSKVWDEHLDKNLSLTSVEESKMLTPQEVNLRKELALRCCDIAAKMFLRDNYIHGDLHAGNLLYSAKDNLLTVVDAGLTTYLEDKSFVPFGDFLRALCVGDAQVIVEKLVEFNVNPSFKPNDTPAFTEEVSGIFDKYMGKDRSRQEDQLVMGYIMGEVLNCIGRYSITLRGDVSSSLMSISISEGLILSLDPTFDLVGRTLPYFVRYAGWESLWELKQAGYYSTTAKARQMISKGVSE